MTLLRLWVESRLHQRKMYLPSDATKRKENENTAEKGKEPKYLTVYSPSTLSMSPCAIHAAENEQSRRDALLPNANSSTELSDD